jgi:hypothetical protein
MGTTFDKAAVKALFSQVTSHAQSLGVFPGGVNGHAPESPPGPAAAYSTWLSDIKPVPQASGQDGITGRVEFTGHIFIRSRSRPLDEVDPEAMLLAVDLIAAYSGDFTLGGSVMEVDLLGAYGAPVGAQAAWADFQGTPFRVMETTLPLIVDNLWSLEVTS